ncbi:MAG: bifunctional demethylmenaquinone methyltransferase/2-methoxy-6-polyprenyl-1,4-benzoquinol methylase UbiE [Pseudomonadota bacterium]
MSSTNPRFEQGPPAEDIKSLFGSIAHGYDTANDWMTGGLARGWRRKLVKQSQVKPGEHVLDCATGTGDLAIEFAKVTGAEGKVVGTDFCKEMLEFAPSKAKKAGVEASFSIADATQLPFENESFDVVSIAYGIRNVDNPKTAIAEMRRVCKPGGRVMILETGDQQNPMIRSAFNWYFRNVVPRIGGMITGRKSAYEYLQNSSSQFPSGSEFLKLMQEAGEFEITECFALMGGASFIYKGLVKS